MRKRSAEECAFGQQSLLFHFSFYHFLFILVFAIVISLSYTFLFLIFHLLFLISFLKLFAEVTFGAATFVSWLFQAIQEGFLDRPLD